MVTRQHRVAYLHGGHLWYVQYCALLVPQQILLNQPSCLSRRRTELQFVLLVYLLQAKLLLQRLQLTGYLLQHSGLASRLHGEANEQLACP